MGGEENGDTSETHSENTSSLPSPYESNKALSDLEDETHDRSVSKTVARRGRELTREDFMAIVTAWTSFSQEIKSLEANRIQFYQNLITHYLPKIPPTTTIPRLVDAASSSPALSKALDALTLFTLHRVCSDQRLEKTATNSYIEALTRSRRELVRNDNEDKRVVIGTAHMLAMCELFCSTSLNDIGGQPHTRWLNSFMEACRTDPDPQIRLFLGSNIRQISVWEVLISRRRPCRLKAVEDEAKTEPDGTLLQLANLAVDTAGAVEDSDRLCQAGRDPYSPCVINAIQEIIRLEGQLHEWMVSYYNRISFTPYWIIDAHQLGFPLGPGTLSQFPKVFAFVDLEATDVFLTFNMSLVALVESHIDLLLTHQRKEEVDYTEYFRLKKLSAEYADNVCKCIPFMGKPVNGLVGPVMAIRPLYFLLQHFKKHYQWQRMAWCVECAKDLKSFRVERTRTSSSSKKSSHCASRRE